MPTTFEQDWHGLVEKVQAITGLPLKANRRANKGVLDAALAEISREDEAATVAMVKATLLKARELDKVVDDTIKGLLSKKKEMLKLHKQLEAWSQGKDAPVEQGESNE